MEFAWEFGEGAFDVVVRVAGKVTVDEVVANRVALLSDPRMHPGMNALWDYTEADGSGLSADDIRLLADDAKRFASVGLRAIAIAATKPLTFGLVRMFEAHTTVHGIAEHVTVVETVAAAEEWLAGLSRSRG